MINISYSEDFKNSLTSKKLYILNQNYWSSKIQQMTDKKIDDWIVNKYGNGKEINDGNPLFSCRVGANKALRIIQSERNPITPYFASWNTENRINGQVIDELVIAIQPYKGIYKATELLLKSFIDNKFKRLQNKINIEYNKKTNDSRIEYLIKFMDKTGLQDNLWNINKTELIKGKYNILHLKKINKLSAKLGYYESKFENRNLSKAYHSTLKSLWNLNEAVTLKNSYDLSRSSSKIQYKIKIIEKYANLHNFLKSYNARVNNLEDNLKELKELHEKHST
jgi:hypothetical protein